MNLMTNMLGGQLGSNFGFGPPAGTNPYNTPAPTYSPGNPFVNAPLPTISYNIPAYNPAPNSPSNFPNYFNTAASLVSQFLGSRGKYQTGQLIPGAGPGGTIQSLAVYDPNASMAQAMAFQAAANQNAGANNANRQPDGSPGDFINQIFNGIMNNPLYLLLGVGGAYLLFREPPRGRR